MGFRSCFKRNRRTYYFFILLAMDHLYCSFVSSVFTCSISCNPKLISFWAYWSRGWMKERICFGQRITRYYFIVLGFGWICREQVISVAFKIFYWSSNLSLSLFFIIWLFFIYNILIIYFLCDFVNFSCTNRVFFYKFCCITLWFTIFCFLEWLLKLNLHWTFSSNLKVISFFTIIFVIIKQKVLANQFLISFQKSMVCPIFYSVNNFFYTAENFIVESNIFLERIELFALIFQIVHYLKRQIFLFCKQLYSGNLLTLIWNWSWEVCKARNFKKLNNLAWLFRTWNTLFIYSDCNIFGLLSAFRWLTII